MELSAQLEKILPKANIKIDIESLRHYGKDWTTYFDIQASAIVFPETVEQVRDLVLWARREKIALVPSGGRTGLSGAACATKGEVVVSFERMNKILDFNKHDDIAVVQAGVVTETLQKFATDQGLYYPVDFAARGSSHIGGNIATNAGGIKVIRYGMTRGWVAGLKVVTGRGEILELNHGLVKNATGFDLRQLFIGSEGTLGFVVEALMQLTKAPPKAQVLLVALPTLERVMDVLALYKSKLTLVAYEMFSDLALTQVMKQTSLPAPLGGRSPFYVVLEVETPTETDENLVMEIFTKCMDEGWILDGAIGQSETQAKTLWRYREDISESLAPRSPYKNDISVRPAHVPSFIRSLEEILTKAYPTWEVVWFGHIGDGNLHINILRPDGMTKEQFVKECQQVDKLVFETVAKHDGSISAEHGVGLTKKPFLSYSRSAAEIEIMKGIKSVFDPDGIMNPGKVF